MSSNNNKPQMKMPKDAAQLVLWFKGLPQPTAFLTTRLEAEQALSDYLLKTDETNAHPASLKPTDVLSFKSYQDGSGMRSESVFAIADLRGVTIEYATIQLAAVN